MTVNTDCARFCSPIQARNVRRLRRSARARSSLPPRAFLTIVARHGIALDHSNDFVQFDRESNEKAIRLLRKTRASAVQSHGARGEERA